MIFASTTFIIFLALLLTLYYLVPKSWQWPLLLAASLVFYAFSGITNLIYISATIVTTYLTGRRLGLLRSRHEAYLAEHKADMSKESRKELKRLVQSHSRRWLIACMLANFGILAVVKYAGFVTGNINSAIKMFGGQGFSPVSFLLPMGISFYTFQSMGYIIDVYRGKTVPENNIGKFALFVSFFPQLVQGPISRFEHLNKTLCGRHDFSWAVFSRGAQRVAWGFFKKLVIADRLFISVRAITGNTDEYQGIYVLCGMLFYAVTLYCDFTGGIDITIGIAEMLGIRVEENFNHPFWSKNITEYWRRWHISMGTWFRDYLFYPISVSKGMLKLNTKARKRLGDKLGRRLPVYISTLAVWFTTGFWHGASWNFIVWGLANGVVILISEELSPLYDRFNNRFAFTKNRMYTCFRMARTFCLMCVIRTFDTYPTVGETFRMMGTVFTNFGLKSFLARGILPLGLSAADYTVAALGLCATFAVSYTQTKGSARDQLASRNPVLRGAVYAAVLLAIIVLGVYGVGYDASSFIYNQF